MKALENVAGNRSIYRHYLISSLFKLFSSNFQFSFQRLFVLFKLVIFCLKLIELDLKIGKFLKGGLQFFIGAVVCFFHLLDAPLKTGQTYSRNFTSTALSRLAFPSNCSSFYQVSHCHTSVIYFFFPIIALNVASNIPIDGMDDRVVRMA